MDSLLQVFLVNLKKNLCGNEVRYCIHDGAGTTIMRITRREVKKKITFPDNDHFGKEDDTVVVLDLHCLHRQFCPNI